MLTRRRLIRSGLGAAATLSFGPAFWRDALAHVSKATPVPSGPYGPLLPADANGIMLPPRFTSRVIARSGQVVPGTNYVFPPWPDGQAVFDVKETGGWRLVTNTEVGGTGGASTIEFDAQGTIVKAYRILNFTNVNCAGGPTPWATWLSCEEVSSGAVWECDPSGRSAALAHRPMGIFKHEAACVDPANGQVYLSEDEEGGGLYRYTPHAYPDLKDGLLEIACPGPGNHVIWKPLLNAMPVLPPDTPTRQQLPESIKFARGEGIWFDSGRVYLATTTDETIHVYDTEAETIEILYRASETPDTPLKGVDNVHVSRSGDLFVAEDSYTGDPDAMDICLITRSNEVSRFLKLVDPRNFSPSQSETVGICFDSTGTRMYVGSQRFDQTGIVYEISGPFRADQTTIYVPPAPAPPPPPINPPQPGVPIGLAVARRISMAAFIRRGLAVGFTLDKRASVRVRVTARIGKKTQTVATLTRTAQPGHTTLRVKPTKARTKLLKARRRDLKANVEIRITTPGAPVRTLRRTVTLRQ